jgi:hypothetical protein
MFKILNLVVMNIKMITHDKTPNGITYSIMCSITKLQPAERAYRPTCNRHIEDG